MATALIISAILSLIASAVGAGLNYKSQIDTNEANLRSVQETNASNVEQAELSYQRSLPTAQLRNLMDAGLSRAGALNHLSGGGSYTAPVLQTSHGDAPQIDMSGIAQTLERAGNIPSNVEQANLVKEQINSMRQDSELKLRNDARQQEEHDLRMDEMRFSNEERKRMNQFMSKLEMAATEKGISPIAGQSYEDYIRALGLQDDDDFKALTPAGRQASFDRFVQAQNLRQSEEEQRNKNVAAKDAHALSQLREQIEKINVKYYNVEKHQQLLNLMRAGEGLIQENNIKFQDFKSKEFENIVREAGIDDEAEARALGEYIHRLMQEDELRIASLSKYDIVGSSNIYAAARKILRDLGEFLMHIKL